MIYAKKKVQQARNLAAQTAKIIANIKEQIWKDKATALNWIKCLHLYYMLKKRFKESDTLDFRHYESAELIGTFKHKKAIVYLDFKSPEV